MMTAQQIQTELGKLEQLRNALLQQAGNATNTEKIEALQAAQPLIKPSTPQMEALLQAGYGMTVKTAETIIKERDADPVRWPLERYEAAQAMLEAYKAKPQVISTRPRWQRG
jgi:hypothetical protein